MGGGMKTVPGMERIDVTVNDDGAIEIVQASWTGEVVTITVPDEYVELFIKAVEGAQKEAQG